MTRAQKRTVEAIGYAIENVLADAIDDLEALQAYLTDAFEEKADRSDKWADSEKGQEAQAELGALQTYLDELRAITVPDFS